MRRTTIGVSEFLAPVFVLFVGRHVRFFAAVLATALVGVALSTGSARAQDACQSYWDRAVAALSGSDERILYWGLYRACQWGGVNRAEEIRQSGACLSDYRRAVKAFSGSDKQIRYNGLFFACVVGGENRAEAIRETGACLSDYRKYSEATYHSFEGARLRCPGCAHLSGEATYRSGERRRQYNLFKACVGENTAAAVRTTPAREQEAPASDPCDSYYYRYEKAPADSYALILYDILYYACDRGGERTITRVRKHLERGLSKPCHWYWGEAIFAEYGSHTADLYYSLEYACKRIEEAGGGYRLWGFDGNLLAKVREEGAVVVEERETVETREASLTQEERDALEAALAASFGVRDFQKLADDVIKNMGTDGGLKEDLGGTKPPLLIASIENRSGAEIDTQLIHNLIRVRLNRERLFELVRRDHLETLLQEQTLGDLVDAETAAQVGRTLGAQYMLHGSIADDIRTLESGGLQIVYTLTLIVTNIETGADLWLEAAEFIKKS